MASPKKVAKSALGHLKQHTVVVADTGDFESMKEFKPTDATTNPSLILQAANIEKYQALIDEAVAFGAKVDGDMDAKVILRYAVLSVNRSSFSALFLF